MRGSNVLERCPGPGAQWIAAERASHVEKGFTLSNDDEYTNNELFLAAAALCLMAAGKHDLAYEVYPETWDPAFLEDQLGTPSFQKARKAGSLLAAEIDRWFRGHRAKQILRHTD